MEMSWVRTKSSTTSAPAATSCAWASGFLSLCKITVVGRSGSGKSTLVNMITGIDRPTLGEIIIGDTHVHKLTESQMTRWRGRNLGIVFQFYQLLPMLSLLENIMLPMDFCNMYASGQRRKQALQVLELVGVAEHAHKLPAQLSGGEQQRVAIARALANDPPIILADEPTGNLDTKSGSDIISLFESLNERGTSVVTITHDMSIARRWNRIVKIRDGKLEGDIKLGG